MCYASALVFPSELEGLALTVNEAMACGLPVLAQPRSSLPEQVQDGVTGWLLPVDAGEEMTAWAERLEAIFALDTPPNGRSSRSGRERWPLNAIAGLASRRNIGSCMGTRRRE